MTPSRYNQIGGQILDACFHVHRELGPGLLESVYHHTLMCELNMRNICAGSKIHLPLVYKGKDIGKHFEIDILVENAIIIEIKAVDTVLPVHEAQIITYLKLANLKLGYLVNFNVPVLKNGFKRFVNDF